MGGLHHDLLACGLLRFASQIAFTERYCKWCKRHGYNFSALLAEQIHREAREMVALVPKSATTKLLVQEAGLGNR